MSLIILAFAYNLFYVPVAICYEYEASSAPLVLIDVLSVAIYVLDIASVLNTALVNSDGGIVNDRA
jgi:hypothetical protein